MSDMMKFCPECGKQLPGAAKFCDGCGTNVSDIPPATAGDTPPAQQPQSPPPIQQPQSPPSSSDWDMGMRPASGGTGSFNQAQTFKTGTVTPGGAAPSKWTVPIAAVLAVLMILTVLVSVARGTVYRAIIRLNVEKLYDEFYDEFGRYNPMVELFDDVFYYTSSIRIDDAIDFFNSRKVKRSVQKVANSIVDAVLTENPKKLISEKDVGKIVKSLASVVDDKLGYRLSSSDIDDITDYIMYYYLDDLYAEGDRYAREMLEEFWEYYAPDWLVSLRPLLHPATKTILVLLDILAILGLILVNLKKLTAVPMFMGIPLAVGGGFSLILLLLTGVWARILAEESGMTTRIARILLSGYSGTALRYAFMLILFGAVLIVIDRAVLKAK